MICPENKCIKKLSESEKEGNKIEVFAGTECENCAAKEQSTKEKKQTIYYNSREELREKMREKLISEKSRETHMKRQGCVEPTHGNDPKNKKWIQYNLREKHLLICNW